MLCVISHIYALFPGLWDQQRDHGPKTLIAALCRESCVGCGINWDHGPRTSAVAFNALLIAVDRVSGAGGNGRTSRGGPGAGCRRKRFVIASSANYPLREGGRMDPLRRRFFALPAVALFAQELVQGQEPGPFDSEMVEPLTVALNALVTFEVVRRGGQLTVDGADVVKSTVGDGVTRLRKDNALSDTFAVSMAIDAARRFGAAIVTIVNQQKANLKKINAENVKATLKKLCPMYPFC